MIKVIILYEIIINAKDPNGCELNEDEKSPLNKYEIDLPNPQPGQKSIPIIAKGQIVKWLSTGELIKAR
jgi:hypothetical protein